MMVIFLYLPSTSPMNGSPWQREKRSTRASACKKAKGQKRLSEAERKRDSEAEQSTPGKRQGCQQHGNLVNARAGSNTLARLHRCERAKSAGHPKRQEKQAQGIAG